MSAGELIVISVMFLLSGFFSGIETGMISINRLRLRHLVRYRVKGAEVLQDFLQRPDYLLGTTLVGNNIANTTFSVLLVGVWSGYSETHGAWMGGLVATVLLLVFCEYLPKAWFRSAPAQRCLTFAPVMHWFGRILYPVSHVVMRMVQAATPFLRTSGVENQPLVTRDEFMHIVHEGHKTGTLSQDEVRMISGVFELRSLACKDIMTPMQKAVYVHPDTSHDDICMLARARPTNQFPVYDRGQRLFVGVVYIVDVLSDPAPEGKTAKDYMRPPQLVAADTPVDHVLPRMRVTRQPIVLVTDREHRVVGFVTIGDVVEEIVG
ncbi:MAG TPA: hemolysin family protein [Kiritimatiellia bacterium]|nr:hemolysin family protein [Kiritimatiellia bacterium]